MTVREIGSVVRQARYSQGLRQDQLAGAANVGVRFLVELERGKPTVRFDKVLAVLRALGCRLDVTPPPQLEQPAQRRRGRWPMVGPAPSDRRRL
jgi:y4mF family transcriptional regulator